jgi:hypothetical protein
MTIDPKYLLDILIGLGVFCGGFYKLGKVEEGINHSITQLEKKLYLEIDSHSDEFKDRLVSIEKQIEIHLSNYGKDREMINYRLVALDEKIKHEFERLNRVQSEIQGFLQKHNGFIVRAEER